MGGQIAAVTKESAQPTIIHDARAPQTSTSIPQDL